MRPTPSTLTLVATLVATLVLPAAAEVKNPDTFVYATIGDPAVGTNQIYTLHVNGQDRDRKSVV